MIFTIRNKIIIITIAILFLAISVNSAIISIIYSNEHYDTLNSNAKMLAHNLGYQLEKLINLGLELESIEGFDQQCEDLVKKYRNISYAVIINNKGEPAFRYYGINKEKSESFSILNPSDFSFMRKHTTISRSSIIDGIKYYEVFIPVYDLAGNYIAAAGVGFPQGSVLSHLKFLIIASILISIFLCIAAIALLIFFLTRWVTNPIRNLVQVIDEIRRENTLGKKVEISSFDEIGKLASAFNNMTTELDESRNALIETKNIEKEMEIAKIIQTGILPKNNEIPGYTIALFMRPASDVGGDYYDVITDPSGNSWVNIGDVMGHGVTAGIIMMMLQSSFFTAVNSVPRSENSPHHIFGICNKIIFNNIKNRLYLNQFITACFFKCRNDGRIEYAGAHEHLVVYRHKTSAIEIIPTQGVWLGLIEDISEIISTYSLQLDSNDILLLYTDGLIQMRNKDNEEFTLERLAAILKNNGINTPEAIKETIINEIDSYCEKQEDDITFVIVKKD